MATKNALLTVLVVFVVATLLGYLIHGVLLRLDYEALAEMHRSQPLFPYLLLGNAAFSTAFVALYARTTPAASGLKRGLTFGFLVWLLWPVPIFLIDYAGQRIPGMLTTKQIILELPDMLILGLLAARLYRSAPTPATLAVPSAQVMPV